LLEGLCAFLVRTNDAKCFLTDGAAACHSDA
jgi:hypothetical protein